MSRSQNGDQLTDMTGQILPLVSPEFCYYRNDQPFFPLKKPEKRLLEMPGKG